MSSGPGLTTDCACSGESGMSLLELTLVISLIAILLALAVPGYEQHVARSHRATAIELLLDAASCQERVHAVEFSYDTRRCLAADTSGRYVLRYEPADTASTMVYTAIADPQPGQSTDPCGSLRLDHQGNRAISGPTERTRRCWEGR